MRTSVRDCGRWRHCHRQDQPRSIATGLVGVSSPYGIPNNPMRGDLIPGGSSSGSAVAFRPGFGWHWHRHRSSGRVPSMLNNKSSG